MKKTLLILALFFSVFNFAQVELPNGAELTNATEELNPLRIATVNGNGVLLDYITTNNLFSNFQTLYTSDKGINLNGTVFELGNSNNVLFNWSNTTNTNFLNFNATETSFGFGVNKLGFDSTGLFINPTNAPPIPGQFLSVTDINGHASWTTLPPNATNTSELTNDGADGVNPFITANDIPTALSAFTDDIGATDGILPLSVFLDTTNGNDTTGELENYNKPFQTLEAIWNALPPSSGETYTIYMTGATVLVNRRVPPRNIKWVSFTGTTLDFSNVYENDGVTLASEAIDTTVTGVGTWTFENSNINIRCERPQSSFFFYISSSNYRIKIKGNIGDFYWNTIGSGFNSASFYFDDSQVTIERLYDGSALNANFTTQYNTTIITIKNYYAEYKGLMFQAPIGKVIIEKLHQIGTSTSDLAFGTSNGLAKDVTIGNINITGRLRPNTLKITLNGNIGDNTVVDLSQARLITGNPTGTVSVTASYINLHTVAFEDFEGRIEKLSLSRHISGLKFKNCIITTPNTIAGNAGVTTIPIVFEGYNQITQEDTTKDLFQGYRTFDNRNSTPAPLTIDIYGTVVGNYDSFGFQVSYNQLSATFKEKLGERVIRSKFDITNQVLDTNTTYIIDGTIELSAGEYIQMPPTGNLTINGYGLEASQITKNVLNEPIFINDPTSGTSGGLQCFGLKFSTPQSQVFDIIGATGNEALELNVVNFEGCDKIGTFDNYRQFLGTTIGIYGCSDGFELRGAWSGFKITNTNCFGFGATGTLFKAGLGLTFSNRFYGELNVALPTGAVLADFATGNFSSDKLFQLKNGQYTLNGTSDASTNTILLIPNITEKDSKTLFENNVGLSNSYKDFARIKGEDGLYYELYIDATGTLSTRTN